MLILPIPNLLQQMPMNPALNEPALRPQFVAAERDDVQPLRTVGVVVSVSVAFDLPLHQTLLMLPTPLCSVVRVQLSIDVQFRLGERGQLVLSSAPALQRPPVLVGFALLPPPVTGLAVTLRPVAVVLGGSPLDLAQPLLARSDPCVW